jgi:CRISPR/Cas system-associated endonuclease Cas3-HD
MTFDEIKDNIKIIVRAYRNMDNYIQDNERIKVIYEKCNAKEQAMLSDCILNLNLEDVRVWVKANLQKLPYEDWTVYDLRKEAVSLGIKDYLAMPKSLLIMKIKQKGEKKNEKK